MKRRFTMRRLLPMRLWALFHILGPGLIAANADNDAGGIFGYSQAGAQYQYNMLWILVLSTVALGVAQEICARMAAVTGKGLADLMREEYEVRMTVVAMSALLIANFFTTVSEFAGILVVVQLFPIAWLKYLILPAVAAVVWFLVAQGSYRKLERILLGASAVYLLYIISAFLARPQWGVVFHQMFLPDLKHIGPINAYVFMVINVVGTTITPWGQFYIQSSVRDKGVRVEDYRLTRIDVLFGAFFTNLIAFFIIVCCGATLYASGNRSVADAGQAAAALAPLAGKWATVLFAVGMFNASCFGAIAVPLSTAYAVTEALGWESALGSRAKEAPLFIGVFTFLIVASLGVVFAFPHKLAGLIILPNIVGAILLPIILVLMLKLVNNRHLMGEYTNSRTYNFISVVTTTVLIVLSVLLLCTLAFPQLGQ